MHCTVCNCDFSVAGSSVHEVKWHCVSAKHTQCLKTVSKQPNLAVAFSAARPPPLDQVTMVALYFASFIIEHNLSFTTADHFSKLRKRMLPDSKIAEQYASARMKTTAIITHALAPTVDQKVTKACQSQPFSILCDGGNNHFDSSHS